MEKPGRGNQVEQNHMQPMTIPRGRVRHAVL